MQRMGASLACVCVSANMCAWARSAFNVYNDESEWKKKPVFISQFTLNVFISSDSVMEIEMPCRATTGEEFKWWQAWLRLCVWVCVCMLCMPRPCTHTCTGIRMCTHQPGNETVCLPCITNRTQVRQAMKRLSTFNMQLDFFFFFFIFKATRPSDYPSDWKPCEMSDLITPSLSAAEQEYCKVSKKENLPINSYFVRCSAKWAAAMII